MSAQVVFSLFTKFSKYTLLHCIVNLQSKNSSSELLQIFSVLLCNSYVQCTWCVNRMHRIELYYVTSNNSLMKINIIQSTVETETHKAGKEFNSFVKHVLCTGLIIFNTKFKMNYNSIEGILDCVDFEKFNFFKFLYS